MKDMKKDFSCLIILLWVVVFLFGYVQKDEFDNVDARKIFRVPEPDGGWELTVVEKNKNGDTTVTKEEYRNGNQRLKYYSREEGKILVVRYEPESGHVVDLRSDSLGGWSCVEYLEVDEKPEFVNRFRLTEDGMSIMNSSKFWQTEFDDSGQLKIYVHNPAAERVYILLNSMDTVGIDKCSDGVFTGSLDFVAGDTIDGWIQFYEFEPPSNYFVWKYYFKYPNDFVLKPGVTIGLSDLAGD